MSNDALTSEKVKHEHVLANLLMNGWSDESDVLQINSNTAEYTSLAISNGISNLLVNRCQLTTIPLFEEQLKSYSRNNSIRLALLDATAINLMKRLLIKGIPFVVLKGFALAHRCYDHPSHRQRSDVDIIIPIIRKNEAMEIFQGSGYDNPRGWSPKEIVQQFTMRKTLTKDLHLDFDVHLQLSNDTVISEMFAFSEIAHEANVLEANEIKVISVPFSLLHAILHLLHHRQLGDHIKLIWLYDIHLMLGTIKICERARFLDLCNQKEFISVVIFALDLVYEYFPSESITEIQAKLNEQPKNRRFDYLLIKEKPIDTLLRELKTRGFSLSSIKLLQETLFPPIGELRIKYGRFHLSLTPYYYLKRIYCGLMKKMILKQDHNKY